MRSHEHWDRRCEPCGLWLYGADVVNHRCPAPVAVGCPLRGSFGHYGEHQHAPEPRVEAPEADYVPASLDDIDF